VSGRFLLGVVLVWTFCSDLHAQTSPPWPAPEVCNDALLEDYQRREELIFDLVMYMHECRERFGGCSPDSNWAWEEGVRRWRADHPREVLRERDEHERFIRELTEENEEER